MSESLAEYSAKLKAEAAARQAEKDAELERIRTEAKKRREEEAKAKQEAQQAAAEAHQRRLAEEFDSKHKPEARMAWRAPGGTEESFQEAWPKLRQELLTKETLDQQAKARAAVARNLHSMF